MPAGTEPRCFVCGGPLGAPVLVGLSDFAGDPMGASGQTLTLAPGVGIGKGRFLRCPPCQITYRTERVGER